MIFEVILGFLGNCMAIGKRAENFLPNVGPPLSVRLWNGEFDRRATLAVTDETCATKESIAQGADGHFLHPSEVAGEKSRQVVSEDGEGERSLRSEELLATEAGQPKTVPQFPDHILDPGPAIVVKPDLERRHAGGRLVTRA